MASKPPEPHLPGCRWAWDGSPCLCPGGKLLYVEPFYREDYSEEEKANFSKLAAFTKPVDPLHPTGRCTCGGEGRCTWCSRPCPACGVPTIEHGDTCISMQRACSRCGGLENVLLLHYGWACDFCLGGDRMPDYEALGYPETGFGECDLDHAAYLIGFASRGIAVVSIQRELDAIQKDIRSSSDIVDSSSSDSYK